MAQDRYKFSKDPTNDRDWLTRQRIYWDYVAPWYDKLYTDEWSRLEDEQTRQMLQRLGISRGCNILELGCGTGLGFQLCSSIEKYIFYTGIDISPAMIAHARRRHPTMVVYEGDMGDLSRFADHSFEIVLCLYTSFSYAQHTQSTLHEVYRVIKPGGRILLSVLNRTSLRRLLHLRFGSMENYVTRKSEFLSGYATTARVWTRAKLRSQVVNAGFGDVRVVGQSILGGVAEHKQLWWLDKTLASVIPLLCDIINVTAVRSNT